MNVVSRPGYRAVLAADATGRQRALALRRQCFRSGASIIDDSDAHDPLCQHLVVEDVATGDVVACCRLLVLGDGREVGTSYSALHYDLGALAAYSGVMMEVGRFCIDPARRDPDILRHSWAALTRLVDRYRVDMLFGCSSFPGTDVTRHRAAFVTLTRDHAAPERWAPGRKSAHIINFADLSVQPARGDHAAALLPPLLRSYLGMGGWVSNHAVIDRDLDTLHVFTAVEIAAIPPVRARTLRLMAAKIATTSGSGD